MSVTGDKHLRCSFCGKSKDSVKKFISGPSVYICNECVSLCNEILAEEERMVLREARKRPLRQRARDVRQAAADVHRARLRRLGVPDRGGSGRRRRSLAPHPRDARSRDSSLMIWRDILPIDDPSLIERVSIGETQTPLLKSSYLAEKAGALLPSICAALVILRVSTMAANTSSARSRLKSKLERFTTPVSSPPQFD